MAGGNTAGCKGGKGTSNWGWMRVNACFFTPSLSYKAIACVQRPLSCFWSLQQLANFTDFKLDDVMMHVYMIICTDSMYIMIIFEQTLHQMQAFVPARAICSPHVHKRHCQDIEQVQEYDTKTT